MGSIAQEQYLTLFTDRRTKKTTGSRWAVKVVETALTLLRAIWQARNDAINKSPAGEGPTIKEHNTTQWVHKFYENQETMVPPTDRLRLFDTPLAARNSTQTSSPMASDSTAYSKQTQSASVAAAGDGLLGMIPLLQQSQTS